MIVVKCRHSFNKIKNSRLLSQRTFEEIKIPMPWGHLAGKWWYPHDKQPILAMHGWQDNAGSFDRLIAYLPPEIGILSLDLPGHGLSSHLPKGSFYHMVDSLTLHRRIIRYFNWDKVSLLGHSLGASINSAYAMVYPNDVNILICLDGLHFSSRTKAKAEVMAKTINDFLKYDTINNSNSQPPCYTIEELKQRLHVGSKQSINVEYAEYLLKRNTFPAQNEPGKFYINRDMRLKVSHLMQFSPDMILEGASRINCPVFISLGKTGFFSSKQMVNVQNLVKHVEKHNKNTYYYEVEGTHHVHLNNPERLADLINGFLSKHYLNEN